ncbi:MAG TPA: helix-turn-helix domain-containing protein [Gemmatimonadales bacterium]|nr:helix-turn-helix domain-containing protein [Gemmatimonadales bacterium]
MTPLRILCILPDDGTSLAPLAAVLREGGHDVRVVAAAEAERALAEAPAPFDAVLRAPLPEAVAPSPLEAAEKRHIAATLHHTRGNKRQAAHLLGIARSTLLAKVRKYEL